MADRVRLVQLRFGIQPILYDNEEFRARVGSSVATLDKLLSEDEVIYGTFRERQEQRVEHCHSRS